MELKCEVFDMMTQGESRSNRTFMELKWFYRALPRKLARRSNRTFMELK